MSTSLYTHEFTWSGEGENVIATGSFDDWKSTLPLTRNAEGKLTASLPVAYGTKITFKYVVDGNWQYNPNEPHETDASGNVNNVFTTPASPPAVPASTSEAKAPAAEAATIIPLPVTSAETPALPVPASVAATDNKVDSVVQPTSTSAPVTTDASSAAAAASTSTEEAHKSDEQPDLLKTATAGVAAIALGAAGLAGAAISKVTGHDPIKVDPTPNASLSSPDAEKPLEPTHTPAVIPPPATGPPTTSLPTVPSAAAVSEAVEKNEHVKTTVDSGIKPVAAVAGAGVVAGAAGAAALATHATGASEAVGQHTAESATFQKGEQYLKGFAAKAGKEKELHDVAVKADGYLAQAKAEGSKRYAEGEKMAGDAYEKVAATSFGASTMHALGLDKKHASSGSVPTTANPAQNGSSSASAAGLPKIEAVPDPGLNSHKNQTTGSTMAVTDPAAPVVSTPVKTAPAVANLPPSSPAGTQGFSTAPSTPAKSDSAPATPSKDASGLGHGNAPGSTPSGKTRKPSFFKRLLGGSKSGSPSK